MRIKTVLYQSSCPIYSDFRRLAVLILWKMPRITAQTLSHYKSCYIVVLRDLFFLPVIIPHVLCYHTTKGNVPVSYLCCFHYDHSIEKSLRSRQWSWWYLVGHCISLDWIFFLTLQLCFPSWLRNAVNQIPLTCREFECPVHIMALETPPYICAMVSACLGLLAFP